MQKSLADALFSKVRQSVLGLLFRSPDKDYHLREIARLTKLSAPTVRLELNSLVAAGVAVDSYQGNMRVFRANPECPLFGELRGIAVKTFGIADQVKAVLDGIDGIDIALIFGSVARQADTASSDVDVLIIGSCRYGEVVRALHELSKQIGREINAQVYMRKEFSEKVSEKNHFVIGLLEGQKIFLKGDQHGLEACQFAEPVSSPPHGDSSGT